MAAMSYSGPAKQSGMRENRGVGLGFALESRYKSHLTLQYVSRKLGGSGNGDFNTAD